MRRSRSLLAYVHTENDILDKIFYGNQITSIEISRFLVGTHDAEGGLWE